MANLFDKKIKDFLYNNFKNQADIEVKINRDINEATALYEFLVERFGNVENMSDNDVNQVKIKVEEFKRKRNRYSNKVNSIIKHINDINRVIGIISSIISLARGIINILTKLPIPARFLTAGIIVAFSDKVQKAVSKIEFLSNIIETVRPFLNIILQYLLRVQSTIQRFDSIIALIEAFLAARNKKYLAQTQLLPIQNVIIPNTNVIGTYKDFVFEIRKEDNIKFQIGDIKRNYAIAIDTRGIERLRSAPSFASDPQVLIDELRFVIDRDNLKA